MPHKTLNKILPYIIPHILITIAYRILYHICKFMYNNCLLFLANYFYYFYHFIKLCLIVIENYQYMDKEW